MKTSLWITPCIFDLCAESQYLEINLEGGGILAVLRQEGDFQTTMLHNMPRLHNRLKDSERLNPPFLNTSILPPGAKGKRFWFLISHSDVRPHRAATACASRKHETSRRHTPRHAQDSYSIPGRSKVIYYSHGSLSARSLPHQRLWSPTTSFTLQMQPSATQRRKQNLLTSLIIT